MRFKYAKATRSEVPPDAFVHALRQTFPSVHAAAVGCGCGYKFMQRVLAGQPVSKARLEAAMHCFNADVDETSALRLGMRGIIGSSNVGSAKLVDLLQQAARFVELFDGKLKLTATTRGYYVFPPRDTILRLVLAYEECRELVRSLHEECPEYDDLVFRKAKNLRQQLTDAHRSQQGSTMNAEKSVVRRRVRRKLSQK